ncbi:PepSY domain-containing protein [Sphingobacterium hungaricum]|uniref:NADPH--hemoprotein reductase n=1 Tax=Sphingobacterium hungaricum TaxID=2082723 RepID=A0A928YQR5_9SPHI|nr:PepSY domain-containing protein [Sphingobacterium hungaricum]MBE8713847.1 FAD-binding oxidoreductase [Sphingobacterium hungaricum]
MTLSIWRYAHLALAIVSSLFLLILSITGVILAYDAVDERLPAYRTENFDSLTLAEVIPELRKVYPDIIEIAVDHNHFVSIDAMDEEGNTVKGYIDPNTGAVLGELRPKSDFIQWITALHRSLFIHETGRVLIGITSFLLLLITLSGIVLIIKRQQGIRHFFDKINRDFFAQYFHVVSGRLFLLPIVLIALTGTYLFLIRMDLIKKTNTEVEHPQQAENLDQLDLSDFPIFNETSLSEVEKIEFPFIPDDAEEFFVLKLKKRVLSVNQITGEIVEETKYPYSVVLERLSLDLHTGRTSIILAIVLGLASLNIVFFIYSGFVITFKRTRTKIRNKIKPDQAEIVILVGSENGSTLFFADKIHKQLLADGKKSFLTEMNKFRDFPNAQHILVFTSTYGLGNPPTNALQFGQLLDAYPLKQEVQFSVLGFGSKAYPDFCEYAVQVDQLLAKKEGFVRYLTMHTVNDRSVDEFVQWVHRWSEKSLLALATAPAVYQAKLPKLKKFKVVSKTLISEDNATFKLILKPTSGSKFQSGDLLAIYPADDHRERFYSIGVSNNAIQLMVKLYPDGLGSSYLYALEENSLLNARIMDNPNFYFPKHATAVAMIANGTGIAPFLGMIAANQKQVPIHLYAGFRHNNSLTKQYQLFASEEVKNMRLKELSLAFSREKESQYVMDLIRRDAAFFLNLLENAGIVMICGSLNMQKDVEKVLEELSLAKHNKSLDYYKEKGQILSDCY